MNKTETSTTAGGTMPVAVPPGAEFPHWTETLRDGSVVKIRPIRKQDADLERAFIEGLSPRSRRYRFFGQMPHPSDDFIRRMTDIDYSDDMAFVAVIVSDGREREIGASRYSVGPDGRSCECAVAVADEWQNRGLGALLMRHLIEIARARGIRAMVSIDLSENAEMRDLAQYLGFRRRPHPDDGTLVVHTLDL